MAQREAVGGNGHGVSSSDSDPSHKRPVSTKSVKIGDRKPLRTASSQESVNQRKLGTRITDLETQLGQAQQELKLLKGQLATAEAAKKDAQQQLRKTKKTAMGKPENPIKPPVKKSIGAVSSEETHQEAEAGASPEVDLMGILKTKLEEKERELKEFHEQNENLRKQLSENGVSSGEGVGEMMERLKELEGEMESSRDTEVKLTESLEAAREANRTLEEEIKKMRVQTEQWRKAADAAAAVLARDADANGGRNGDGFGASIFAMSYEDDNGDGGEDGLRKSKGSGTKIRGLWKKHMT